MQTSSNTPHRPFLEALAAQEWSTACPPVELPAFFLLRLFEMWLMVGNAALDRWGIVRSIQGLLSTVPASEAPSRAFLSTVLAQMETAPRTSPFLVAPALLAYGIYLTECGKFALAVDVLQAVADALHPYTTVSLAEDFREDAAYDSHLVWQVRHHLRHAQQHRAEWMERA